LSHARTTHSAGLYDSYAPRSRVYEGRSCTERRSSERDLLCCCNDACVVSVTFCARGTVTPCAVYSFILLRKVRIEIPRPLAVQVRFPQ
jgi:hypothetical protein